PFYIVQPQGAHIKNPVRRFSQLDHPLSVFLQGSKMKATHLCYRVAKRIVNCPFGKFSPMNMGCRKPADKSCCNCAEYLEPVAENNHDIRGQPSISLGETAHRKPHGL